MYSSKAISRVGLRSRIEASALARWCWIDGTHQGTKASRYHSQALLDPGMPTWAEHKTERPSQGCSMFLSFTIMGSGKSAIQSAQLDQPSGGFHVLQLMAGRHASLFILRNGFAEPVSIVRPAALLSAEQRIFSPATVHAARSSRTAITTFLCSAHCIMHADDISTLTDYVAGPPKSMSGDAPLPCTSSPSPAEAS